MLHFHCVYKNEHLLYGTLISGMYPKERTTSRVRIAGSSLARSLVLQQDPYSGISSFSYIVIIVVFIITIYCQVSDIEKLQMVLY